MHASPDPVLEPLSLAASRPPAGPHADPLFELTRLLMGRPADDERAWPRVADAIASLLGAQGCAILFSDSESGTLRRHGSRDSAVPAAGGRPMLTAPIAIGEDTIGMVQVYDPPDTLNFDARHVAMVRVVALWIGRAVETDRLHKLLHSRFALCAVAQRPEPARDAALREALGSRSGLGRLVARSLYRELRKAGFDAGDIVNSASELIAQLSAGLRGERGGDARTEAPSPTESTAPAAPAMRAA
ncbi:MAG TPA: hypothetical protein VFX50_15500 [Gemmatimonadales bacterium]|nr:hypothetical protein [Gemmatimonadales bacterium]